MTTNETTRSSTVIAIALLVLGVAIAAAGIYVGETDDAPGAALIGLVVMAVMVVSAVRRLRR